MPIFLGNKEIGLASLGSLPVSEIRQSVSVPFELGQFRDGGYVFFITGSLPNQKILISANEEATVGTLSWGCSGIDVITSENLFSGSLNTQNILAACSETNIGARYCDNLNSNGFSDWYLPSKDELNQLYINRSYVPGIVTASLSFYMSSTQGTNNTNYWSQNFNNGQQTNIRAKVGTENNRVRAIRMIIQ
jgi:hypothetical protein